MEDKFNDYIEGLESHKWVGVSDLSEQFGVSERTVFQWLKDGKIKGVKWKGRRLIDSVSVPYRTRLLQRKKQAKLEIKKSVNADFVGFSDKNQADIAKAVENNDTSIAYGIFRR